MIVLSKHFEEPSFSVTQFEQLSDAELDSVNGGLAPVGAAVAGAIVGAGTYLATTPSSQWNAIGVGTAALYGGAGAAVAVGTGFAGAIFGGAFSSFGGWLSSQT